MTTQAIAIGRVEWLCINGEPREKIELDLNGPVGDRHSGFTRNLSGHDGEYIRTSAHEKGDLAFNWRTCTVISYEEQREVELQLQLPIPQGCLLETMLLSGIPRLSQLAPTSRLVLPERRTRVGRQATIGVWEENGPCKGVGDRLEAHYKQPGLTTRYIAAAQGRRGFMGFVLFAGEIHVGDAVLVYPPA